MIRTEEIPSSYLFSVQQRGIKTVVILILAYNVDFLRTLI